MQGMQVSGRAFLSPYELQPVRTAVRKRLTSQKPGGNKSDVNAAIFCNNRLIPSIFKPDIVQGFHWNRAVSVARRHRCGQRAGCNMNAAFRAPLAGEGVETIKGLLF
jgi:hypothetical protein